MKHILRGGAILTLLSLTGCVGVAIGVSAGVVGAVTYIYVQTHEVVRR